MTAATLHIGDVFDVMATMPDGTIDLVLTSPPFLALRSYLPADHPDKGKEIGSEPTPAAFLDTMLALTAEWGRLLTPTGSIAVELGDTYAGSGGAGGDYTAGGLKEGQNAFVGSSSLNRTMNKNARVQSDDHSRSIRDLHGKVQGGGAGWPLDKSLAMIPQLYAASLAYGRNLLTGEDSPAGRWRVRNYICWARPNPPVGALGDKWRPATSYVTVATRSRTRYFDLDAVRSGSQSAPGGSTGRRKTPGEDRPSYANTGSHPAGAPPLDWVDDREATWEPLIGMPTAPYPGAHYATFPSELPRRLIECMAPREVCATCGEPRRRELADRSAFDVQPRLAAHIKERREALGITSAEVNGWFGFKEIAKNWERTDKHGAAIPSADVWPVLKERLGLSDEFDEVVLGPRSWTHSTVQYVADGLPITEKRKAYGRGGGDGQSPPEDDNARASRVAPDRWTDCGCGTGWRPGVVLDPFAGSGTTLAVAHGHGRTAIGIDLNDDNEHLIRDRVGGLFLTVVNHKTGAAA